MTVSRPWLALALALFCLPLFVGLGRTDVGHDEAIYTFAVDRILEIGDWLTPKSSPHEDEAFLEKPPLKFWIVAAPIRFGLLPHTEFGIRFWDALFGAVAFIYIFLIGVRLAGPVCGAVALLVLFVHWPLLFDHGLRSNNMEASLFLSYCGGIYHFLAWAGRTPGLKAGPTPPADASMSAGSSESGSFTSGASRSGLTHGSSTWWHPVAVGLYFVLGFMTKFVAALFLPAILALPALVFRAPRIRLVREWRLWAVVGGLVLALVAPWFVYANVRFGSYLWHVILAEHVYTRFRTYLNPVHVQPWSYYFTEMFQRFGDSGAEWLVVGGMALLVVQSIRRRWLEGTVVLFWFALPIALISLGTSKLYHYAYPFLPPLALAAGYLASMFVMLAPVPLARGLRALGDLLERRVPSISAAARRPGVRAVCLTIAAAAVITAAVTEIYGPIRLSIEGAMLFKSSGVMRPVIVALLFGLLGGAGGRASRAVVALLVLSLLPLQAYREQWPRLTIEEHPMRTATDCVRRVQAQAGGAAPGLYVDLPGEFISHPLYYYFRRVRPWTRAPAPDPSAIGRSLDDPAEWKPMLVWDSTYQDFVNTQAGRRASPPMIALPDVVLLLPGPYASCGLTTSSDGSR